MYWYDTRVKQDENVATSAYYLKKKARQNQNIAQHMLMEKYLHQELRRDRNISTV